MSVEKLSAMFKKMQSRVDRIELRLIEEQKENKAMRERMDKLSGKKNANPKRQKLKTWLEEKVGLPQYFDLFIENGIDDMLTAKLLTAGTLRDIGVEKIGERMKILHYVSLLNQNYNDEGKGTTEQL